MVLQLADKVLPNDGLLVEADGRVPQQAQLVFLLPHQANLGGAVDLALVLLRSHPLLPPRLLQPVLYPRKEHQVELSDVLLVADHEVIAVVVHN